MSLARKSNLGSFNPQPASLCPGQNYDLIYRVIKSVSSYKRYPGCQKEICLNWNVARRSPQMLQPHLKGGVVSEDYVRIGLGGISATFSPSHKFKFISVWYKWGLIKQNNVNHYLAPCGKIEYLLVCIPCGRSPPCLGSRGHITDVFSQFYLLFAGELVGPHFWPEQRFGAKLGLLRPKRNSPSVTSTRCIWQHLGQLTLDLYKTWKCHQALFPPFN